MTRSRPLTVNLMGAGRVGRTLSLLWTQAGLVTVQDVLTQSRQSAEAAVAALGSGRAVDDVHHMRPADLWLLATPDGALSNTAQQLALAAAPPSMAWHCSGFESSLALQALRDAGWQVASTHPALSFADPELARAQFAGTVCALEGDAHAMAEARRLFTAVGARCFTLSAQHKPLYHGAAVLASNFAPVLQAAAAELWQGCGMPADWVDPLWQGFLRKGTESLLKLGPAAALTGPAARGDTRVVEAETAAMALRDPALAQAYAALSTLAEQLARQGHALQPATDPQPPGKP
jgi:predicted short-subunit dehydrogenase-like oxidoreductase (DUF2520 family)